MRKPEPKARNALRNNRVEDSSRNLDPLNILRSFKLATFCCFGRIEWIVLDLGLLSLQGRFMVVSSITDRMLS